jgi:hypothetical protein
MFPECILTPISSINTCGERVRILLAVVFSIDTIADTGRMLTIPHCKESLSRAYITAVVGRARHHLAMGDRQFDYKVDGTIKQLVKNGQRILETGYGVDFQAKSTVDWEHDGDDVLYDLEVEAYNYLVLRSKNSSLPCILVLLCLAKTDSRWLELTETELTLRNCLYWSELRGHQSDNSRTQRIRIPRSRRFTPEAVEDMMQKVSKGESLL